VRHHGLGETLQAERSHRAEGVPAATARKCADDFRDEYLVTLRGGTQARGLDDRRAVRVRAVPGDVAGAHPDPHGERGGSSAIAPLDRLLDRHRGRHCLGRADEGRQNAVAQVLDHRSAVCRDRVGEQPLVRQPETFGGVLPEPRP
jgi:hypothetical protein